MITEEYTIDFYTNHLKNRSFFPSSTKVKNFVHKENDSILYFLIKNQGSHYLKDKKKYVKKYLCTNIIEMKYDENVVMEIKLTDANVNFIKDRGSFNIIAREDLVLSDKVRFINTNTKEIFTISRFSGESYKDQISIHVDGLNEKFQISRKGNGFIFNEIGKDVFKEVRINKKKIVRDVISYEKLIKKELPDIIDQNVIIRRSDIFPRDVLRRN